MENNWKEIVYETYQLLYEASEPKADFSKLLKEAKVNKNGEKEIDFLSYEIEPEKETKILNSQRVKYNMDYSDFFKFCNTIRLGCSPKYKSKPNCM